MRMWSVGPVWEEGLRANPRSGNDNRKSSIHGLQALEQVSQSRAATLAMALCPRPAKHCTNLRIDPRTSIATPWGFNSRGIIYILEP